MRGAAYASFAIIITMIKEGFSWINPEIALHKGFANINDFALGQAVHGSDLVVGQPYTLTIQMPSTDRYDYLLQRCTYNNKYGFIDQNSCLLDDKYFQYKWENDQYQQNNAVKRTFVHFMPPEPLSRLDCSVRVLQCCGCAEAACGRNILPSLNAFPQRVIHLTVINEVSRADHMLGASFATWPWWIWLLIALPLLLLLCLLPLLFLLCARRKKVTDVEAFQKKKLGAAKQTQTVAATAASTGTQVMPIGEESRRVTEADASRHRRQDVYRTPSESPSASVQSTASHSRSALVVKQSQPSAADRSSSKKQRHGLSETITREERTTTETNVRPVGYRNRAQSRSDDWRTPAAAYGAHSHSQEYLKSADLATQQADRVDVEYSDLHTVPDPHHCRQQTTSEEKFFKKSDHRGGVVEEGYDQALLSYSSGHEHYSHSAIV